MMYEWVQGDLDNPVIETGYIFSPQDEDTNPDDSHGLKPYAINAVILCLAVRMLTDFKLDASANLITKAAYAKQIVVNASPNRKRRARYRGRTPTGSGNRLSNIFGNRYYPSHEKPLPENEDD